VARSYDLSLVLFPPDTPIGYVGGKPVLASEELRLTLENIVTNLYGPTGSEDVTLAIPSGSYVAQVLVQAARGLTVSGVVGPAYTATVGHDQDLRTTGAPTFGGLTITGSVSVNGTVDGRDVSADGTKLDGIEAGATADQTAAEILTAIKTVDGAGSGLDADLFDAQSGAFYLAWANFTGTPTTLAGYGITDAASDAELAAHEAAADPHTGYQRESEKNAASGYAGLNSSSRTTKGVDTTDDVIVDSATKGLVLKDTQGTPHYWRVTVNNSGALVTTDLGTTKP